MTLLIAISIAFAVLAFFFLFRMLHCMRRRRVLRACGSSLSCLMCAAIAGAGSILILSYLTYSRLIDEQLISRIEFEKTANDEYQARLMITGESDQFFYVARRRMADGCEDCDLETSADRARPRSHLSVGSTQRTICRNRSGANRNANGAFANTRSAGRLVAIHTPLSTTHARR